MNDFDFDELDKAVNKLADKTQEEQPGSGHALELSVPIATPAERRASAVGQPTPPPAEPMLSVRPRPAPVPTPSLAANPAPHGPRLSDVRPNPPRRPFMDIVPPGSRKSAPRTAGVVQPVSAPETIIPQPAGPSSMTPHVPDGLPAATTQPQAAQQAGADKWPDPLDVQPPTEPEAPAHSTPFLAGAKVEKRPLGAYSAFQPAPPEPAPVAPELPPQQTVPTDELTPESDGTFKEPEPPAEKPADDLPMIVAQPSQPNPGPEPAEPEKPDLHSAAMMSIPQQYHAQEKPVDSSTRSVFDTKQYHPPLADQALKEHRRGAGIWVKVFIALIILALLAAGGYLLYVYVLQR